MRHPLNWTLGSTVLLSLALLSHLAALGEATRASAIDDLKSNSLYWKRDRLPSHSPNQQASSSKAHFRKRSLYAHVNDDVVVTPPTSSSSRPAPLPIVNRRPHLIDTRRYQGKEEKEGVRATPEAEVTHDGSLERAVETANKNKFNHATHQKINSNRLQEDNKVSETTDKLNFWADDNDYDHDEEDRTLIEPHYPSIDLFDEEELLEVGEDGILRAAGHHRSNSRSSRSTDDDKGDDEEEGRHDQVWLVDEWEEELEGDMDEWMDWVEENHTLNRMDNYNDDKNDKHRLRDQSAMESLVLDEDEASPFQRLFSESWLF
ncbi:hypothetical protein BGZ95_002397 [Linnemannia exigua]|uniref:Uncharacterized protein n=1 Tax=Linnemannia exigua TaxID=604196 RepID=A0AAD4D5L1_9FUNG|nr:hypothetical protein BGZ95_002397 [Linnemannia exigua]